MKATVHGCRRIDMTDDQTQRRICGYSIFISYPSEGVTGEEMSKQFLSDEWCSAASVSPPSLVGKKVNIDFTPRGRVSSITADAR